VRSARPILSTARGFLLGPMVRYIRWWLAQRLPLQAACVGPRARPSVEAGTRKESLFALGITGWTNEQRRHEQNLEQKAAMEPHIKQDDASVIPSGNAIHLKPWFRL
jgi:hypothetical protein